MATGITPDIFDLESLDRRAVVSMVRDMGVTGAAGAILGNRLRDHLSGNPGAVMEQMEAFEEAGWLSRQSDGSLKIHRNIASLRSDPIAAASKYSRTRNEAVGRPQLRGSADLRHPRGIGNGGQSRFGG